MTKQLAIIDTIRTLRDQIHQADETTLDAVVQWAAGSPTTPPRRRSPRRTTSTTALDDGALGALHDFAWEHKEIPFAHMVTAAAAGQRWARDRIRAVLHTIEEESTALADGTLTASGATTEAIKLRAIRSADTTPPGGGALRSLDD